MGGDEKKLAGLESASSAGYLAVDDGDHEELAKASHTNEFSSGKNQAIDVEVLTDGDGASISAEGMVRAI